MDRFEDLRTFTILIDAGSVTAAAQTLNVAPSAVSRRLRDLEARLGAQLVQRTTRRMRLTATGERFLTRAHRLLEDLADAEQEAGDQQAALAGPLRIAVPVSFATAHLAPVLSAFAARHPDVVLDIEMSDRLVDLIAEGHDLAVRIGALRDSTLMARKLTQIRMALVAAPAFWDRHGRPGTPGDLTALPALGYRGSDRADMLRYHEADGSAGSTSLRLAMLSNNGDLLCQAAEAGLGFTCQPSFLVAHGVARGTLEPVLTETEWPRLAVSVVYPETRHLPARARALIDHLRAHLVPPFDWEAFLDTAPG